MNDLVLSRFIGLLSVPVSIRTFVHWETASAELLSLYFRQFGVDFEKGRFWLDEESAPSIHLRLRTNSAIISNHYNLNLEKTHAYKHKQVYVNTDPQLHPQDGATKLPLYMEGELYVAGAPLQNGCATLILFPFCFGHRVVPNAGASQYIKQTLALTNNNEIKWSDPFWVNDEYFAWDCVQKPRDFYMS